MSGIYILTGDNTPDKELFLKTLLGKALPGSSINNGLQVYHASEAPAEEIVNALSSGSIFSESTCVIIRGCEEISSDTLKVLSRYIKNPSPQNTLIMEGDKISSRITATHPFHKAVKESSGTIIEKVFASPPSYKIPEWIVENASSRFKRNMNRDAAGLLHEFIGDDLLGILNELEKMDIVLPEKAPIKTEDVEQFAGRTKAHKPWDLPNPVARKELANSIKILNNLFDFNTPSLLILYSLGEHFIRLLKLKLYFAENPNIIEQAKRLGKLGFKAKDQLNPLLSDAANESGFAQRKMSPNNVYAQITLPKVLDQVECFSLDQLYYIIRLLALADTNLKNGQMRDSLFSMEKLVMYIIFSDKFRASNIF